MRVPHWSLNRRARRRSHAPAVDCRLAVRVPTAPRILFPSVRPPARATRHCVTREPAPRRPPPASPPACVPHTRTLPRLTRSHAPRALATACAPHRFDLALSRALQGPAGDVYALTDHVQATLRARHAGGLFAAPGTCTLVPLPGAVAGPAGNAWGARVLAVLPTMRVPADVSGQSDLAYNSMRALLGAVAAWNADADGNEAQRIGRIVMTGLGTGTGGVSAARCARQMVLAVKHARTALPTPTRWEDVAGMMDEVAASIAETASASSDASDAQA